MKLYGVIYKITHNINKKCNVGQTVRSFDIRMKEYKTGQIKRQWKIYSAIQKYGWDSFSKEIIVRVYAGQYTLNLLEESYIALYDCVERGYNLRTGGSGGGRDSLETRAKKSAAQSGANHPNFGITYSPERCLAMSIARLGSKNHNFGKKFSASTIAKQSAAKQGSNHPMFNKKNSVATIVKKQKSARLKVSPIVCDNIMFHSGQQAATILNINQGSISANLRNKRATAGGKIFRQATIDDIILAHLALILIYPYFNL